MLTEISKDEYTCNLLFNHVSLYAKSNKMLKQIAVVGRTTNLMAKPQKRRTTSTFKIVAVPYSMMPVNSKHLKWNVYEPVPTFKKVTLYQHLFNCKVFNCTVFNCTVVNCNVFKL